jgi:phospholipid transport system transporter-binding protein
MIAEHGRLAVTGHLTVDVAGAIFAAGRAGLEQGDLLVDFSRVESVDSSSVSLLLAWERAARQMQRNLKVAVLPDDLLSLSRLYGVEEMLPQST